MRKFSIFIWFALFFEVNAFPFDCDKSVTSAEKAVCASVYLQQMDAELNMYYMGVAKMEPQNKIAQLRTAQIKWISIRDQCQDEKCI